MATLKRDIESTLGCAIFTIVYLAVLALALALAVRAASRESATGKVWYGAGVEVLVIATLIATLAHVLALGWVRARCETMSLRAFIGLQSVVALLSAALFFVMKGSLYGAAVWIGPAAITLACYSFVFRRQTMQQG